MSYDDFYEDEYEPSKEELEEEMGMEDTQVKNENGKLKIEFDTENFARGIMDAVVVEVRNSIGREIVESVKKEVLGEIKEEIKKDAHEIVKGIVDEYVENEKIVIGSSSPWDDTPREEMSVKQYMKRCVREVIEKGKFRVYTGKNTMRGDGYTEYSFTEYVSEHLKLDNDIKKYLDQSIAEVRDQVNRDVKAAFDESTKTMLSNAVLQVLMANDTYKKIENNISCIASKKAE